MQSIPNSPRRDLDFGVIIHHPKNPEIRGFVLNMVEQASQGIVNNMLGMDGEVKRQAIKK
jgi:hypothetical protein